MYTPSQSLRIKGAAGDPLPAVFKALDERGTRFLRGQLSLICAAPGVGKSAFILTYALRAGIPTMYFSADSDPYTQLSRMCSILTGWDMEKSARLVRDGDLNGATQAVDEIPIRFNYSASPSLDDIETSLAAYEEVYGDFPALVIVDNITNVRTGGLNEDDPFAGLESLMDYLHDLARKTKSCVVGLHHVQGQYNDGNIPIPLGGVKGQIARVPEMVLSLHRVEQYGTSTLRVSTIKNRAAKADPSGLDYVQLAWDGAHMQISDMT